MTVLNQLPFDDIDVYLLEYMGPILLTSPTRLSIQNNRCSDVAFQALIKSVEGIVFDAIDLDICLNDVQ